MIQLSHEALSRKKLLVLLFLYAGVNTVQSKKSPFGFSAQFVFPPRVLSPGFIGPFKITDPLTCSINIHLIFHVSLPALTVGLLRVLLNPI